MESLGAVLPLALLAVLGYFLLIRPTRRRAQEVTAVQSALAVDAEVMLTSGFFGQVTGIDGEQVSVEIAPGVVVRVHRGAIAKILTPANADTDGDAHDLDDRDDLDDLDDDVDGTGETDEQGSAHDPDTGSDHDPRGAN